MRDPATIHYYHQAITDIVAGQMLIFLRCFFMLLCSLTVTAPLPATSAVVTQVDTASSTNIPTAGGNNPLWQRQFFYNLPLPASVNSLLQDDAQQVWVGTDIGLFRVEHNSLHKVAHAPELKINQLLSASAQQLYLASERGIWHWSRLTNAFKQLACGAEQPVWQLLALPSDALLALSSSGVLQLSSTGDCKPLQWQGLAPTNRIEQLALYQQQLIVAVRDQGLMHCQWPCTTLKPYAPALAATRVRKLVVAGDSLFVTTHKHGFYQLNNQGQVLQHWHRAGPPLWQLPKNGVLSVLADGQQVWAGLWAGGLHQFDLSRDGQQLSSHLPVETDPTSLGGQHISALLRGNDGNLYIGHERGLSVLAPALNQYAWLGQSTATSPGLQKPNSQHLLQTAGGALWLATSDGLYRLQNQTLTRLAADAPEQPLPVKAVWQLKASRSGLLLGSSNGVWRLNSDTMQWQALGPFAGQDVYRLAEAADGSIWLSLWAGGIAHLSANGELLGHWFSQHGLQSDTAVELALSSEGDVFVHNDQGLFRFAPASQRFVRTMPPTTDAVLQIATDKKGRLWLQDQQFNLWSWQGQQFKPSRVAGPQQAALLVAAPAGSPADLLIYSRQQLSGLTQQDTVVQTQQLPALPPQVTPAALLADATHLWLATNLGLFRYPLLHKDTDAPTPPQFSNQQPSNTRVTNIRLFNQPLVLPEPAVAAVPLPAVAAAKQLFGGRLQLDFAQDLLTFEFANVGFQPAPSRGYRYRLYPFDRDWLSTAADATSVTYTRLPPGHYQLEIFALPAQPAATQPAAAQPAATIFNLTILPPWYLTWWAKMLAVLLAVSGVLLLIRGRTYRLAQRNRWLEQKVAERTAALEQANLQLQRSADLDALTGLLNRRGLHRRIEQDWSQWQACQLLVIADIDHFKQFNDQHGHHVGDEVLQECARRLSALLGPADLLARWGGEEFLWLLRGDSLSALQQRASQLQRSIGQAQMPLSVGPLTVTMTAGACATANQSFTASLQQADALLYQGKANGRDQLVLAEQPAEPAATQIKEC